MTQSQQIIARIYEETVKLICDFYLVAADKAKDEGDENREQALRWLAKNKRMPMIWNGQNEDAENEGFWWHVSPTGFYEPTFLVLPVYLEELNQHWMNRTSRELWGKEFPSFEAAIEAFIEVWPRIKPSEWSPKEIAREELEARGRKVNGTNFK